MTSALTWLITVILVITATIHAYWAMGGVWPGTDDRSLAKTVVGTNGIETMPPRWITGLVTVAIFAAAFLPMAWLGWISVPLPSWTLTTGMMVLTLIFLGRGLGGFVPAVKRMNSEEPFATLDAKYFSPLILAVGLALSYLLIVNPWR
ncbi:MAG: DUF3995 domain-containing protein [Pseudomonadota bacterium]